MHPSFDPHAINHATVAVSLEMALKGGKRPAHRDTLFFGGRTPSDDERSALAGFALRKNYNLIFASFDPGADPLAGPTGFDAVVTDGATQSIGLKDGRLWKRDRRGPAVLLFAGVGALIRISAKGHLVVQMMKGRYHDQGYEFAREAVRTASARKPGHVPVVSPTGTLTTVFDVRSLARTFEAA